MFEHYSIPAFFLCKTAVLTAYPLGAAPAPERAGPGTGPPPLSWLPPGLAFLGPEGQKSGWLPGIPIKAPAV